MQQPAPNDWPRISRILEEALELPQAEVAAFLDSACAGDPAVRASVERLLAADRQASGFLDVDVAAWVPEILASTTQPNAGSQIVAGERLGAWRLLHQIGRGGMGAVVLAERADGAYEQRVAIKRIRWDIASPDALRRFERERRILARLEHPSIARAVDGGTGPDGTPWLAMEYVAGEPITSWCARRNESLERTLALFQQALRAVQFAHQQFVVHRDLKPSNIFVSDSGEIKLLDFGIAKLLSSDGEDPAATVDLDRRLTPYYAAPEQIRGDPVSTATDVYALGVVLYELLTGVRPHGSSRDVTDAVRRVMEEDPALPSVVLARSETGPRYRAWRERVRGDLDNIVLKALRREANERYSSAQALLDDLERWQRRMPVLATPQTRAYRARRFVTRNRVAVIAGSAVAASLVAGLSAVSWQRNRALVEAEKAKTTSAFVSSLLDLANPNVVKGGTLSARALLDRGAERAERELAGQPEVQAEVYQRLASLYADLIVNDRAQFMAERALELGRRNFGGESPQVAASLTLLGGILTNRGRYTEAESVLVQALVLARRLYGPRHLEVVDNLSWLGTVDRMLARYDGAERYFREAIAIEEALLDANHPRLANDVDALGMVLFQQGKVEEALALFERALALRRRTHGDEHVETAYTMQNIAGSLPRLGRFAEAESLHVRTLEIRRRLLGSDNVVTAQTLWPLALLYLGRNEYRAADSLITAALHIFRSGIGDEHPLTMIALMDAGVIRTRVRDFTAAESLLTRAIAVWSRMREPNDGLTLSAMGRLADVYRATGDVARSERLFHEAVARERTARGTAWNHALSYDYSALLRSLGRHAEAESIMMPFVDALPTGNQYDRTRVLLELAMVFRVRGRLDESRRYVEEAVAIAPMVVQPLSHLMGGLLAEWGRTLVGLQQHQQGDSLLRKGIRIMETAHGRNDAWAAEARVALAMSLIRQGRASEARPLLEASLPTLSRQRGVPDPVVAEARAWLKAPAPRALH